MGLDNLKVFQDQLYTTAVGTIGQQTALFNAATKGALVLTTAAKLGDFAERTLYARIPDMIRRRSPYSNGDVSEVNLEMLLSRSVKVGSGTPPVRFDPAWWAWMLRNPGEAGAQIGLQLGQATVQDQLNTALKALVAALANEGDPVTYDGTAGFLTYDAMNTGASKFGDASQQIACWIAHSTPYHKLIGLNLANAERLFQFGTVSVMADHLGRPIIVTDAPDLKYASGGDKYRTLGLVSGAAAVEQSNDFDDNTSKTNGKENINRTYQAEWSYSLSLKGYAWNSTDGGKAPSNAAIGTGTNWDIYAENVKDTAGVMLLTK